MKKRLIALGLSAMMILSLAACGGSKPAATTAATTAAPAATEAATTAAPAATEAATEEVKHDTRYLICSATPATSANYAYYTGFTNAITTVDPWFQFTVSETSGAGDSTKRIVTRDVDLGNTSDANLYDVVNGKGSFEGHATNDTRILWNWSYTVLQLVVTKDSGITSLKDLEGKRFNPGATGSAAQSMVTGLLDSLDIHPDYFQGSQGDASDAILSRQIVGVAKNGPLSDSYILQIQASLDIDIISMTDEEIAAIQKTYPYAQPYTIPAGTYPGVDHDVKTIYTVSSVATMKDQLSQQEGYEMISALVDNEECANIWKTSFPQGADIDVPNLTASTTVCCLHPGTVQYLKEKGIAVDPAIIPEEYKE